MTFFWALNISLLTYTVLHCLLTAFSLLRSSVKAGLKCALSLCLGQEWLRGFISYAKAENSAPSPGSSEKRALIH